MCSSDLGIPDPMDDRLDDGIDLRPRGNRHARVRMEPLLDAGRETALVVVRRVAMVVGPVGPGSTSWHRQRKFTCALNCFKQSCVYSYLC